MPTDIVKLDSIGVGFITKSDDDNCPKGGLHEFEGVLLTYVTRRGDRRYISGKKYYLNDHSNDGRPKKIHRRMRIVGGESCCIKCGCPYTSAHNPHFL